MGYRRAAAAIRWARRYLSFNRCVRLVAFLLPPHLWYRAALAASRLHGQLSTMVGGNGRFTEAIMLDHWLRRLTVSGAFPIPWTVRDSSGLNPAADPARGVLFCWTHTPLAEIPLSAYLQLCFPSPAVISDRGNIAADMRFHPPGLSQSIPAIAAGAHSLLRARTILRAGGGVVCMADQAIGGPLSSSAMRLAGRVGARVVFQWAERRPDGVIELHFVPAPCPNCASAAEIATNLQFLETHRSRLFAAIQPESRPVTAPAIALFDTLPGRAWKPISPRP